MEISALAQNGFRIRGKEAAVVINPSKPADLAGTDIAIFSGSGQKMAVDSSVFTIANPVEYEIKGVRIYGYESPVAKETLYLILQDELNLAYFSSQTKELNKELAEEFATVNVLFVSAKEDSADLISQLEPNVVVPFDLDPAGTARFQKEMGEAAIEKTQKLKLTSFSEEDEETKVVIFN